MSNNTGKLLEDFDNMADEITRIKYYTPYRDELLNFTRDGNYNEDEIKDLKYCLDDCKQILRNIEKLKNTIEEYISFFNDEIYQ